MHTGSVGLRFRVGLLCLLYYLQIFTSYLQLLGEQDSAAAGLGRARSLAAGTLIFWHKSHGADHRDGLEGHPLSTRLYQSNTQSTLAVTVAFPDEAVTQPRRSSEPVR